MVATDISVTNRHPYSICIVVEGGKPTNPIVASQIGNDEFAGAVADTMLEAGLFSSASTTSAQDCAFRLNVALGNRTAPGFGYNTKVDLEATWRLTDLRAQVTVFEESVSSSCEVRFRATWDGVKRFRLANECAAKANILDALSRISRLELDAT
jgi:hypothetical protein